MASITTAENARPNWSVIAAASVGNALEWFDFVVYGFFATTMAKLFFPTGSDTVSLLLAFASFGVTFFMRPLGAIVLGGYADRHGRKTTFVLTIRLMMIGTGLIALAPTYSTAGLFAPALVIMGRLIQGFSAGAEFGSATAFLAEQNPVRRGYFASWQFASQGLTTILATVFGVLLTRTLSPDQINSWGWRIPFLFGLLIGPVAYYIRRYADETVEFRSMQMSKASSRLTLNSSKLRVLTSFGVVVLCNVGMYTILFMPTFAARQLGLSASDGFVAGLLTGAIQLVLIPLIGAMTDRYGRLPIAFASSFSILLLIWPLFYWLAALPTFQTLLIVQAILGLLLSVYMGGLPALMSELFPTSLRTTGLSVSYALGAALFGGFAPFINAWLLAVTGSNLAPSYYLMLAAVISLVSLTLARRFALK
jgi:MHS family proline/betaine transporter-like MFS transporter